MKRTGSMYTLNLLKKIPNIIHGFGTRNWKTEDFRSVYPFLDFNVFFLKQIHSDIIHIIGEPPYKSLTGDAMITDRPGILLAVKTADCLPILLADKKGRVVAAVHCGWRSTGKEILRKTAVLMMKTFGIQPSDIVAGLGPSIGKTCYEVGADVKEDFAEKHLDLKCFYEHPDKKDKYLLDIKEANQEQLLNLGIHSKAIASIDLCTHCEKDLFSYRLEGGKAGRLINFIGIKKN